MLTEFLFLGLSQLASLVQKHVAVLPTSWCVDNIVNAQVEQIHIIPFYDVTDHYLNYTYKRITHISRDAKHY